jgi:hypothetical protein
MLQSRRIEIRLPLLRRHPIDGLPFNLRGQLLDKRGYHVTLWKLAYLASVEVKGFGRRRHRPLTGVMQSSAPGPLPAKARMQLPGTSNAKKVTGGQPRRRTWP